MKTQIKIRIINKAGNRVAGARVAIFDGDAEIRSFVSADGESSFEPDPEYAAHLLRVRVSKGKSAQEKTCRLEGEIVSLTFELEEEGEHRPPPPPPLIKRLLIPAGLVLLGLIVWLVWSLIPSQGGNPRVLSFEASPGMIPSGGTSALSWSVEEADAVEILPGIGAVQPAGKSTVTLSQTTTYTLLAKNATGETTAEVTVEVGSTPAGPRVISFTANPETIQSGAKSSLAWKVEGADSVEISPGIGAVESSGKRGVAPSQPTKYTLVARNAAGETSEEVTIRVGQSEFFEISSLRPASPAKLSAGNGSITVMLRYSLQQAGTLNVIPLDANKHAVANVGWQARNGTIFSGKVGSRIDMPVAPGSGKIEMQFKAMQPAQVRFLRLRVVRGSNVPLLQDIEVNYRFVP